MTEPTTRLDRLFEDKFFGQMPFRAAAPQLQPQQEPGGGRPFSLPLDFEDHARALLGMLPQVGLVGISFVQTRREGVTPLPVAEHRQNLNYPPARRCRRQACREPEAY